MRYILVEWPNSQKYQEMEGCYPACDLTENPNFAIFVPELLYCKIEGTLYPFFRTVRNEELQYVLSQYPEDATVAVEYCDVKKLRYFPDRNFIAIN